MRMVFFLKYQKRNKKLITKIIINNYANPLYKVRDETFDFDTISNFI